MPDRKQLVYSRERNDKRIYGVNVYKPHFLDILATRCKADIEEAKRRVIITREGKYMYTPSKEYVQYLKKHTRKVK
jgi:hypothetical protein